MEVFVSSQYLLSKYFSRNIKDHHHFKSLAEYKEFKELNSRKKRPQGVRNVNCRPSVYYNIYNSG